MEKPEGASTHRISRRRIVLSDEDLMVNILSRLSVKALSRLKCVSKQWNMLISDSYFVSLHLAQATRDINIMKVLCVDQYGFIKLCSIEEKEERITTLGLIRPKYPVAFHLQGRVIMAGHPCNGLICLTAGGETLVFNPTTWSTMVIPRGNERKCNYVQGLGFCSSSNEFKVVRLFERSELDTSIPKNCQWYGCELFTVGQRGAQGRNFLQHSRSWRHVGDLPYRIAKPVRKTMCYVNGRAHWMILPIEMVNSSSSDFILSLDLELEEFKVVSRPEHWAKVAGHDLRNMCLKELGGKLCVMDHDSDNQLLDIWVLKDYTNSIWNKEYHINLETSTFHPFNCYSVVATCRDQLFLGIHRDKMLCYYDPRTNVYEELIDLKVFHVFRGLATYVESLINPF